jgi:ribonuclease P protein component
MSASFGFGRDRRLRRRADFLRVQGIGLRASTPHFVLLVARRQDRVDLPSRLGIVVTKKVGNAVARARVKRVCRECFRLWPGFVPYGIELVVIARDGADELGLAEVHAEWERGRSLLLKRCAAAMRAGPAETPGARPPAASSSGASHGHDARDKRDKRDERPRRTDKDDSA